MTFRFRTSNQEISVNISNLSRLQATRLSSIGTPAARPSKKRIKWATSRGETMIVICRSPRVRNFWDLQYYYTIIEHTNNTWLSFVIFFSCSEYSSRSSLGLVANQVSIKLEFVHPAPGALS